MNILGAIAYLSVLAVFGYALYLGYLRDRAAFNRQEAASLEAKIKDQRAQLAAFATLFNLTEDLKKTKEIYERELAQLDQLYEQAIDRNMLLHKMYGAFDTAMKESEL